MRVKHTGGEGRIGGGQRCEMSVVQDNEAVCMHGVVTVLFLGHFWSQLLPHKSQKANHCNIPHTLTGLTHNDFILQRWLTTRLFLSLVCGF